MEEGGVEGLKQDEDQILVCEWIVGETPLGRRTLRKYHQRVLVCEGKRGLRHTSHEKETIVVGAI